MINPKKINVPNEIVGEKNDDYWLITTKEEII